MAHDSESPVAESFVSVPGAALRTVVNFVRDDPALDHAPADSPVPDELERIEAAVEGGDAVAVDRERLRYKVPVEDNGEQKCDGCSYRVVSRFALAETADVDAEEALDGPEMNGLCGDCLLEAARRDGAIVVA